MKQVTLIGLCCIIYFSSCTKTVPTVHAQIDSFLLQNFNYKVGTYWIYRDSITGEEDSFFVGNNNFSSTPSSNNINYVTDMIYINIYQYNSNNKVVNWKMFMSSNTITLDYIGNIEVDYDPFINVPYEIGKIDSTTDTGYVWLINNYYTVNSNVYSNVVIIRHAGSIAYPGSVYQYNNIFYFNSDIGIIKMNLNQDVHNIWELERYKIIK